jgi:hypothetical protein
MWSILSGRLLGARLLFALCRHGGTPAPRPHPPGDLSLALPAARPVVVPHGRRTERINRRDLEVLELIARYGTVPRDAVARWSRCGRSVAYERERRLRLAGLIETIPAHDAGKCLLLATAAGRRACGRPDLPPARPSPATLAHEATVARLGVRLEEQGANILAEREIVARERAEGERIFSASRLDRFHRADLILLTDSGPEAIEVELTVKGARRLDAILRAWRSTVGRSGITRVVYHCDARVLPFVEKGISRTLTAATIEARPLEL